MEGAELGKLLDRVHDLEQLVRQLERDFQRTFREIDLSNLAEEFVNRVLEDYWNLLDNQVRVMQGKLGSKLFDHADLMQEVLEYLLRWCLPRVEERSTKYHLWMPYLKRSIQNCFVNLANKRFSPSRYSRNIELTSEIIDSCVDLQHDTDLEYAYHELVASVRRRLNKVELLIFDNILEPSLAFNAYYTILRARCNSKKQKFSYRKIVAEYYELPEKTVSYIFARFKTIIKEESK